MLRNADDKTIERLSSEYPQAESGHKDQMYERVKGRMNGKENNYSDEVRGVERYSRRHLWKLVPVAAMSIVLIGGAVGGGLMMLKNSGNITPSAQINEESATTATAEATENTTVAETEAAEEKTQSGITKEQIYALCENFRTRNFDRISYSYKLTSDYDTGYRDETSGEVYVDNTQNTESLTSASGYYRGDGSVVHKESGTEYICNGKRSMIYVTSCPDNPGEDENKKTLHIDEENAYQPIDSESMYGAELLADFNDWDIIGTEEYLGRKCVLISGKTEQIITYEKGPDQEDNSDICTNEYTIMIDIETGVWMKSEIKHTDFDLEIRSFVITDIGYGDNAKSPMSKDEFRQAALDGCFKMETDENGIDRYEPVVESDLAFLD